LKKILNVSTWELLGDGSFYPIEVFVAAAINLQSNALREFVGVEFANGQADCRKALRRGFDQQPILG
jgi:hypothetical protein